MNTKSKCTTMGAAAGALVLLLATPSFAQSSGGWNRNDSNRTPQADRSTNRNDAGRNTQVDRGSNRNDTGRNTQVDRSSSRVDPNQSTQADRSDRRDSGRQNGSYRENQRVTLSGRVTSFTRERDGYRVHLDGGGRSFWAPQATFGGRGLRAGLSISVGGIFRGGSVFVDAVTWPGYSGYGYNSNSGYGYDNGGVVRGVVDRIDARTGMLWVRDEASGRLFAADMRGGVGYGGGNLRSLRSGDYVELMGQWTRGGVFDVAGINNLRNGRY